MDAVYARSGTLLEAPIGERLSPGNYCAQLSLADAATGAEDETECMAFSVTAAVGSPRLKGGGVPPLNALPGTIAPGAAASGVLLLGGYALVTAAFLLPVRRRARRGHAAPPMPESHP